MKASEPLMPSLIDRLTDLEPDADHSAAEAEEWYWDRFLASLKRDIQWLLNTQQHIHDEDLEGCIEARNSLLTYGFPDFSEESPRSLEAQRRLKSALERVIQRFEPRLSNVHVTPLPTPDGCRVVHFRLEAYVSARPRPRRVAFDTLLDVDRLECRVEELP